MEEISLSHCLSASIWVGLDRRHALEVEGAPQVQSHLGAARPAHEGLKEGIHAKDIKKGDINAKI